MRHVAPTHGASEPPPTQVTKPPVLPEPPPLKSSEARDSRPQEPREPRARVDSRRHSAVGLPPPTVRALQQGAMPPSPALPRPVDAQGVAPVAPPELPGARSASAHRPQSLRNLPPIMPQQRSIEGNFVLSVLRFVSQRFGERALSAVLARLNPDVRKLFEAGVQSGAWLPFDAVCALVETIDATLGRDDLRLLADCGRAVAEGVFEQLRRRGPPEPPPELLLAEMPSFIESLIRGVSCRLRSVGRGYGRLELDEQGAPSSLTMCVLVLGFLDRCLSRFGANEVEVNLLNCRYLGDDENIYDISWLVV
jgi:eukaryotic-like serine/threonine-protein kinase